MPYTIYAASSAINAANFRKIYVFEGTAEEWLDRTDESALLFDKIQDARITVVETLEEARSVIQSDYGNDCYDRARVHLDRLAAEQARRSDA